MNNIFNLKSLDPRQSYENNDTLRRVRHSKDNVPIESIKLTQVIGEGEFGSVYKGNYMTDSGVMKDVAIKALSSETIEPSQSEDFLREAKVIWITITLVQCLGSECSSIRHIMLYSSSRGFLARGYTFFKMRK